MAHVKVQAFCVLIVIVVVTHAINRKNEDENEVLQKINEEISVDKFRLPGTVEPWLYELTIHTNLDDEDEEDFEFEGHVKIYVRFHSF